MKYLLLLIILISTSCFAQFDANIEKKSLKIDPIVVNLKGDTAIYMHWVADAVDRSDTTVGCNVLVRLYDRSFHSVASFTLSVPASVVKQWALDPKPIDDFILSQNPRLKRKTQ